MKIKNKFYIILSAIIILNGIIWINPVKAYDDGQGRIKYTDDTGKWSDYIYADPGGDPTAEIKVELTKSSSKKATLEIKTKNGVQVFMSYYPVGRHSASDFNFYSAKASSSGLEPSVWVQNGIEKEDDYRDYSINEIGIEQVEGEDNFKISIEIAKVGRSELYLKNFIVNGNRTRNYKFIINVTRLVPNIELIAKDSDKRKAITSYYQDVGSFSQLEDTEENKDKLIRWYELFEEYPSHDTRIAIKEELEKRGVYVDLNENATAEEIVEYIFVNKGKLDRYSWQVLYKWYNTVDKSNIISGRKIVVLTQIKLQLINKYGIDPTKDTVSEIENSFSANNDLDEIWKCYLISGHTFSDVETDVLIKWYDTVSAVSAELLEIWNDPEANDSQNLDKETKNKVDKLLEEIKRVLSERGIEVKEDEYNFEDINKHNIDTWKPTIGNNTTLSNMAGQILGFLQTIGSILSVAVLIIIGIKYMFSSVEEKAKYKETMMPYIIGFVLLFTISTIASIIYNIMQI